MNKEYTIKLVIDESKKRTDPSNTLIPTGQYDPKDYTILINPNDPEQPMIQVAAHELGHVLGRIFKTPEHMNDPRILNSSQEVNLRRWFGLETKEDREREIASEANAWDLAEQMVRIDPKVRKVAEDTYKR